MAIVKEFDKQDLLNEDLPYEAIEDDIIDNDRWSILHQIVFEYEGKYWQTTYSVGATEYQDERPWEYIDKVECTQVELKEVVVKQWVAVKDT